MSTRRVLIGIVGPGAAATERDVRDAFDLGSLVAGAGWCVLTGGRAEGVMSAASRGARQAHGLTIGLLPSADGRDADDAVEVVIRTGLGEARNNVLILSSAAVVVCGMSTGTLSEVALALRADKLVILVRPTAQTLEFLRSLGSSRLRVAETPDDAMRLLERELAAPSKG